VEFCRVIAGPMLLLHRGMTPLRAVLDRGVIAPLSRLLRPPAGKEPRTVSQEELSALLDISAERGEIDTGEQQLLAEVVELHAIRIRDAMLPRQDLPWVADSAGPAELLAAIQRSGRMQVPVLRGSLDGQVLGMVDARRFLLAREQGPRPPRTPQITDFLTPVLFIPAQARLDQCLEQFRRERVHEALCVDEYGSLVGMIRIEDVLRELVGRPAGAESDAGLGAADAGVEEVGAGRWMVPGRLGLRALTEFLATPEVEPMYQRVSTVGGAVIVSLGRVPAEGDVVRLGNVRLEVAAMRGRSVERVLVSLGGDAAAAAAGCPGTEAPA
jgi:putative hemolysin